MGSTIQKSIAYDSIYTLNSFPKYANFEVYTRVNRSSILKSEFIVLNPSTKATIEINNDGFRLSSANECLQEIITMDFKRTSLKLSFDYFMFYESFFDMQLRLQDHFHIEITTDVQRNISLMDMSFFAFGSQMGCTCALAEDGSRETIRKYKSGESNLESTHRTEGPDEFYEDLVRLLQPLLQFSIKLSEGKIIGSVQLEVLNRFEQKQ